MDKLFLCIPSHSITVTPSYSVINPYILLDMFYLEVFLEHGKNRFKVIKSVSS